MTAEEQPVREGDEVLVTRRLHGNNPSEPIPAVVEKAARVWLTIRSTSGRPLQWRMRRDTQKEHWDNDTPGGGMYCARFVTPAQWEREQAMKQARTVISRHGLRIDFGTDAEWSDERLLALAAWLEQQG